MLYVYVTRMEDLAESELAYKVLDSISKGDNYPTKIAKQIDGNRSSINRVIRALHEAGLVSKRRTGKEVEHRLTERGDIALGIYERIEGAKNDLREHLRAI